MHAYLPANSNILSENKVEVHYLGYFLNWHSRSCNYYGVEKGGFKLSLERTLETYSKYNSIDDRIDGFHYYTPGVKFRYRRATEDSAQEIRSGDINREERIALIKKFDHEFPERFSKDIFNYLCLNKRKFPKAIEMFENPKMDDEYFKTLTNNFRSPHIWYLQDEEWKLRYSIW